MDVFHTAHSLGSLSDGWFGSLLPASCPQTPVDAQLYGQDTDVKNDGPEEKKKNFVSFGQPTRLFSTLDYSGNCIAFSFERQSSKIVADGLPAKVHHVSKAITSFSCCSRILTALHPMPWWW